MYLPRAGSRTLASPSVQRWLPPRPARLAHCVATTGRTGQPAMGRLAGRLLAPPPPSRHCCRRPMERSAASLLPVIARCLSSATEVAATATASTSHGRSFAAADSSALRRCSTTHRRCQQGAPLRSPSPARRSSCLHPSRPTVVLAHFSTAAAEQGSGARRDASTRPAAASPAPASLDVDGPVARASSSPPCTVSPTPTVPCGESVAAAASSSSLPPPSLPSAQLAGADAQLLASALAPSIPSAAPRPTASPPPLASDSPPPPPAASLSVPFAPMPSAAASALPSAPDPLEAFASQQSDQPTVDSTKDPTAPLSIPAMPDLPPTQPSSEHAAGRTAEGGPSGETGSRAAASPPPGDTDSVASAAHWPAASPSSMPPSSSSSSSIPSPASPSDSFPPSVPAHSVSAASAPPQLSSNADLSSPSSELSSTSSAALTPVPSFLRPAELSLWSRIKLHPLFKHWPNIGYLISAVSVLVSDILWLRSLLICANCFGILVNRSFNFWTGIYWNIFFICANLLQIVLILVDRRQVELSEEEQRLYDLVFADVFSPQEFKKLGKAGEMQDRPAGAQLMSQGREIDLVYLIVDGLVVVEEERKVAVHRPASTADSGSAVANAVSGLVSSSSPSLLSYVFGSASDDRAHGLSADHATGTESGSPTVESPLASSLHGSRSDSGLVHAVREVAQIGAHVLDQLTGLHQPAQHVAGIPVPAEGEQQHIYQQQHAHHSQPAHAPPHGGQPTQPQSTTAAATTTAADGSATAARATVSPPSELVSALPSSPLPVQLDPGSAALPLSAASAGLTSPDPSLPPPSADRDRRRTDRRAKRAAKRRGSDKQSGGVAEQLGSTGLPSTLVSVSADGSYEIRRETIGYMRSGRLVGEMSLLTTAAPTTAVKQHFDASTPPVATGDGKVNASDAAAAAVVANQVSSTSSSSSTLSSSSSSSSSSLLSSLPSPSELLSRTALSSSSATIATATVTCVEPCRVLVWRRDALRSLFFRFPSLSVGWHATVSSDLIARLSEARRLSLHNGYKLLLLGICAEGSVTRKQRSAADEYRRLNGISGDDHQRTLADLGWTESEWDKGTKKQTWLHRWVY